MLKSRWESEILNDRLPLEVALKLLSNVVVRLFLPLPSFINLFRLTRVLV